MPQSKSAAKRLRQNDVRRRRNRAIRSTLRSRIHVVEEQVAGEENENARTELKKAYSLLDRATARGVVKKNYSSRKKSQLARKLNLRT